MAWEALQQSVLAGSADARAVSLKCMDGRGSDYEREQALAKLYFTDELPECVRSLLAPTFADEPGARAPEPDTAPSVAGDPREDLRRFAQERPPRKRLHTRRRGTSPLRKGP